MPRKTKIIFITVFILVGVAMLGYYFYTQKISPTTPDQGTTSGYNPFSPLGGNTQNTPDGNNGGAEVAIEGGPGDDTQNTFGPQANSKFQKITDFAVAGAVYFEDTRPLPPETEAQVVEESVVPAKNTKGKVAAKVAAPKVEIVPSLRYVERSNGHVHQMYLDTKIGGQISNSTIPNIHETIFSGKAQSIIYRYLSEDNQTITSYLATLGGTKGEFLPSNILDISLSPDKTKFLYLIKTANGVAGATKSFEETKTSNIFNSSFSEWLSQWVSNDKIYLTTKASARVNGSLFSVNISNGAMSKIFGGVPGLTTLANGDGSLVLYSTSVQSGPKLSVLTAKKHTILDMGINSLPEKCVWALDNINFYCAVPNNFSSSDYPDSWYKGLVSFNDAFVKIDSQTGSVVQIADSNEEIPVDATHLFLNKSEDQLFFINKKDSTLWSLDLK